IHIQRAFTSDWKTFTFNRGVDALPHLPSWVTPNNSRVWAPDVSRLSDGTFIMYFTAALESRPSLHCVGFATVARITYSFVSASPTPLICPQSAGGAIDPVGYVDESRSGDRYIIYKVDGNSIGHGGACGNTIAPIVPNPIMLQRVGADGVNLIGEQVQIMTNTASDGPYVEAPTLTFMNGNYVLFFSSKCSTSTGYDVQYAVADKITGPYVRHGTLFKTGVKGMTAPGSMDLAINGEKAIWHGN
ncbi:glycoside hydrolase family 43 protein, partial [Dothistroma septosporum NZE10]